MARPNLLNTPPPRSYDAGAGRARELRPGVFDALLPKGLGLLPGVRPDSLLLSVTLAVCFAFLMWFWFYRLTLGVFKVLLGGAAAAERAIANSSHHGGSVSASAASSKASVASASATSGSDEVRRSVRQRR